MLNAPGADGYVLIVRWWRGTTYVMYLGDGERAAKRIRRLGIRRGTFAFRSFKVILGVLEVRNGENQADAIAPG